MRQRSSSSRSRMSKIFKKHGGARVEANKVAFSLQGRMYDVKCSPQNQPKRVYRRFTCLTPCDLTSETHSAVLKARSQTNYVHVGAGSMCFHSLPHQPVRNYTTSSLREERKNSHNTQQPESDRYRAGKCEARAQVAPTKELSLYLEEICN